MPLWNSLRRLFGESPAPALGGRARPQVHARGDGKSRTRTSALALALAVQLLAGASAVPAAAAPAPAASWAQAPTRGQLLYETHCSGCHSAQMHWRERRVVRDWASLVDQVAQWAARERLGWGEEDVLAVAQHLNETIYHLPAPERRADKPPAPRADAR